MPLNQRVALAVLVVALGSCDVKPSVPVGRPPTPTASAQPTHSEPIMGQALVSTRDALLWARGDAIWRIPLPLGSVPSKRHPQPSRVGTLAVHDGSVFATFPDEGRLARLDENLEVRNEVVVPGADGVTIVPAVQHALVTSSAGEVVAVRIDTLAKLWSVDVGPHPLRIALDGNDAVVARAMGTVRIHEGARGREVSVIDAQALDPIPFHVSGDLVVAFGHFVDERGQAKLGRVDGPALDLSHHVRAATHTPDGARMATDTEVLTVGADLTVKTRVPTAVSGTRCTDPDGIVVDGEKTFVACSDGALVRIGEGGAVRFPLKPAARFDCTGIATGPVAADVLDHYGDAHEVNGWLARYHCTHPDLSDLVELTKTHMGLPVYALVIGETPRLGHEKPTFLINAAHHGSELMSTTFAMDAIDNLLEHRHPAVRRWMREEVVFVVVPLVNPDGNFYYKRQSKLGRKNGRDNNGDGTRGKSEGVDLNRNYPFRWHTLGERGSSSKIRSRYYRGPSAGSEPETQAMMRLAASERFAGSISFHTGTLAILAPYTIPKVKNPTPNEAWTVAEEIAKRITGHPEGFMPVKKNLYAVDGTDQDWFRHEHGTLALLVEGADNWLVEWKERKKMVFWIRRSWTTLVDRYLDGAAVGGVAYDAVLRPIQADISFEEIYRPEKEVWTSRCRDGRFDRYLSKKGKYTLVAKAGDVVAKEPVEVTKTKRTKANIVLPVLVEKRGRCPTIFDGTTRPPKVSAIPTPD